MSSVKYKETLWSDLFPGNRYTSTCLQPAVLGTESSLELTAKQRRRTVWRTDGGAGTDELIRWLLARDYHILVKGHSNRRAHALAKQVARWHPYHDAFLAEVQPTVDFGRPVQFFVKKHRKKGQWRHCFYVSSIKLPSISRFMTLYDDRGAAEIEQFRQDKSGLYLVKRRKHRFPAQKGLILLTDLAHNLLTHFHHRALVGSRFERFGPKRIIRDLLNIPGLLLFDGNQLRRIELLKAHPNSSDLCICLEKYFSGD